MILILLIWNINFISKRNWKIIYHRSKEKLWKGMEANRAELTGKAWKSKEGDKEKNYGIFEKYRFFFQFSWTYEQRQRYVRSYNVHVAEYQEK